KVLLFRGQPALSMARQIAFAQAFGEIETEVPSFAPKLAENPEITLFDSRNGSGRAEMWHTDLTVSETPTAFGVLCVKERPARGGDTMWADSEAAYASLSPGMRAFLEGQRAVHDMYSPEYAARPGGNKRTDLDMSRISRAEHPLVRHLVKRIVWGVYEVEDGGNFGGTLKACFRVAEDGTAATADDDA
ncbi:hypothetical protein C3L29_033915, partial [Pseudomonas sp. MWU12-2534b]